MPEWGFEAFRLPEPGKVSGESNSGESAEDGVPSARGNPAGEIQRRKMLRTNLLRKRPKRGRKRRRKR